MDRKQKKKPAIAVAMAIVGVLFTVSAAADPLRFDVQAGAASRTLIQFNEESGLDVVFDASAVKDQPTRAVSGTYEPADALQRMLVGSGLEFTVTQHGAVSVKVAKVNPRPKYGPSVAQTLPQPQRGRMGSISQEVLVKSNQELNDLQAETSVERVVFTHDDIVHSGARTTSDWLLTLPFNFAGGPNEGNHLGVDALTNTAYGTGANLRGLGARATLVLVNGRRLAPSGAAGTFTDIASIPLTAIDHIEVIGDGASTLYGADAIGGVINFVLHGNTTARDLQASIGGITDGSLGERRYSQMLSAEWGEAKGLFSVEYYQRDALLASQRGQANSDLTRWGGPNLDTIAGNPGTIIGSDGTLWGIPAGQTGVGLKAPALLRNAPNLYSQYLDATVLPREQRLSVVTTAERALTDNSKGWFEALFSRRRFNALATPVTSILTVPSENPYYVNPGSGDTVQVAYGFGKDFGGPVTMDGHVDTSRVSVGFSREAPRDWKITGSLSYAAERQLDTDGNLVDFTALQTKLDSDKPEIAFNPFGDGVHTSRDTLDAIRVTGHIDYRSVFSTANLAASGNVVSLPAGDLKVTVGGEYRVQTFKSSVRPNALQAAPDTNSRRGIGALYAQSTLPIFGRHSDTDHTVWLSLSLGLRDEFYSDAHQGFAPQAHLTFRPTAWATFRTGISKLFRPPNLPDLSETANLSALFELPDPKSPTGRTSALVWTGGNADLKPESAQNVTAGWSFTPPSLPNLSAAVTYFHTVFTNRIELVNFAGDALVNPQDNWLISRNPSADERAQVCARSRFVGAKEDCLNAEVGALIDVRTRNAATLKTDGIDLATRYKQEGSLANVDLRLDAAYLLHYKQADTPLTPLIELRNTAHNPPVLRLRGSATVQRRAFWTSATVNFQSGYTDIDSTPRRPVASWTTADLTLGYRLFSPDSESLAGLQLTLSGQNIFNSNPPFLINAGQFIGYDQENGNLLGRRASIQLEINW